MYRIYFLIFLTVVGLQPDLFGQTTVSFSPSKDNSIFSNQPNNAAGTGYLYSGSIANGSPRRALLAFDLSSIPAGVAVQSATLTFSVNRAGPSSGNDLYRLYRVTTDWGEGSSLPTGAGGNGTAAIAPDATWNAAMFNSTNWTTPGGDFVSLATDSAIFAPGTGTRSFPSSLSLVDDVENWIDGLNPNFGWILIGNESANRNARRLGSKDLGTAPVLTITYCTNTSASITETACDSYTSPSGILFTNSGIVNDTISNAAGCDSILVIDLTVEQSSTASIVENVCGSYTGPSGMVFTQSGMVTDVIPNAAGCDSTISIDLTVNTVNIGVSATDSSLQADAMDATYQWLDCEANQAPIAGATMAEFVIDDNDIRQLAVVVTQNGCVDTSECILISTVSLEQAAITEQIKLFPNPSQGQVSIDVGSLGEVSVKVFNLQGQLVYEQEKIQGPLYQLELPQETGIYLIQLSIEDEIASFRLLRE